VLRGPAERRECGCEQVLHGGEPEHHSTGMMINVEETRSVEQYTEIDT
jgi:hypothetical protein